MTFLAAHAGGHPSGCPHRAGLILKKGKKYEHFSNPLHKREYFRCISFRTSLWDCSFFNATFRIYCTIFHCGFRRDFRKFLGLTFQRSSRKYRRPRTRKNEFSCDSPKCRRVSRKIGDFRTRKRKEVNM